MSLTQLASPSIQAIQEADMGPQQLSLEDHLSASLHMKPSATRGLVVLLVPTGALAHLAMP